MSLSKGAALKLQQLIIERTPYEVELLQVILTKLAWKVEAECVVCKITTPDPICCVVFEREPVPSQAQRVFIALFPLVRLEEVLDHARLTEPPMLVLGAHAFITRSISTTVEEFVNEFVSASAAYAEQLQT